MQRHCGASNSPSCTSWPRQLVICLTDTQSHSTRLCFTPTIRPHSPTHPTISSTLTPKLHRETTIMTAELKDHFFKELQSLKSPAPRDVAPVPKVGDPAPTHHLLELPHDKPAIIVFLRHCGCPCKSRVFCLVADITPKPFRLLFPLPILSFQRSCYPL